MPEEKIAFGPKILIIFFLGFSLSVLLSFSFFRLIQHERDLWKAELTRKAVLAAISFSASLEEESQFSRAIELLESKISEFKQINIYKKTGDKFEILESNQPTLKGETVSSAELREAYEKNTYIPIAEIERSFQQGQKSENHYLNLYFPLLQSDFFAQMKLETSDVYRLNQEVERNALFFLLASLFVLSLLTAFGIWQTRKGWQLYSVWQASARSKDELLSMAAHEMNAPLTAIKASLAVFSEDYVSDLPEPAKKLIDKANAITQNLVDLVEEILTVSRFERGKVEIYPRPTSLMPVVQEEVAVFEEKAKAKGLALSLSPSGELPKVVADPEKIKEVIGNFIANAIKYTAGGTIKAWLEENSGYVNFHVQDSGPGINSSDLPKLFQRFTRLKTTSQVGGTGLGLYISRLIIESHRGKIWAESIEGQGSTFSFSLPIPRRLPGEA